MKVVRDKDEDQEEESARNNKVAGVKRLEISPEYTIRHK